MNIFFLDFDGPLFSTRILAIKENNRNSSNRQLGIPKKLSYYKMDPIAVEMINNLNEYANFKTVISSSWKEKGKSFVEEVLAINGVKIDLHDVWKTPDKQNRANEIQEWLMINKYNDYIVLDDKDSAYGLQTDDDLDFYGFKKSRVFIVNPDDGISWRDYQNMLLIVKGWGNEKTKIKSY